MPLRCGAAGEIISPIISQLGSLPQFVLAATLCPKGTEATLFALMMGVSNFGGTVGSYTGGPPRHSPPSAGRLHP